MNKLSLVNISENFLGSTRGNLTDPEGVGKIVSALISGSISLAGVLMLFLLIGGGIAMISGAGKSDPQSVEKGKKAATSALIGFVVVFSAYWIVKLIEMITGLNLIGGFK